MFFETIILISLVLCSALFSATEIVYIVVNRLKVELKAQQGFFLAKKAISFLNNPKEFFVTCLIGNNIVNITFSSVFTVLINKLYQIEPVYIMLLTSSILLIFGEIIPKVYSREYAERFIYPFTLFIIIGKILLSPLIVFMNFLTSKTFGWIEISATSQKLSYSKEDFYNLLESQDVDEKESMEFIYFLRSLEIIDKKVKEIMIPRIEITAIEKKNIKNDLIDRITWKKNFIILIYQETIDNIIGYIKINDFLKEPKGIEEVIYPVLYVPETLTCSELIEKFQYEKKSVAVIVDEFGGTAGVVTLSTILYEIVEKTYEDPTQGKLFKQINQNTYIIQGREELSEINEKLGLNLLSTAALTLSGYIIENSGRVPKLGEIIKIGGNTFKILNANPLRIELVELKIATE